MVILGRSQCESGCKPPREPIRAPISPYGAFLHSFLSISHICLNIGLEFDCEICPAIADLDHTWDISVSLNAGHQITFGITSGRNTVNQLLVSRCNKSEISPIIHLITA